MSEEARECKSCTKPGTHVWAAYPEDIYCAECAKTAYLSDHYDKRADLIDLRDDMDEDDITDAFAVIESHPAPKRNPVICSDCGAHTRYRGALVWNCATCNYTEQADKRLKAVDGLTLERYIFLKAVNEPNSVL